MCEQVDLGNPMAMVIPWSHGDGDQALATSTPSWSLVSCCYVLRLTTHPSLSYPLSFDPHSFKSILLLPLLTQILSCFQLSFFFDPFSLSWPFLSRPILFFSFDPLFFSQLFLSTSYYWCLKLDLFFQPRLFLSTFFLFWLFLSTSFWFFKLDLLSWPNFFLSINPLFFYFSSLKHFVVTWSLIFFLFQPSFDSPSFNKFQIRPFFNSPSFNKLLQIRPFFNSPSLSTYTLSLNPLSFHFAILSKILILPKARPSFSFDSPTLSQPRFYFFWHFFYLNSPFLSTLLFSTTSYQCMEFNPLSLNSPSLNKILLLLGVQPFISRPSFSFNKCMLLPLFQPRH